MRALPTHPRLRPALPPGVARSAVASLPAPRRRALAALAVAGLLAGCSGSPADSTCGDGARTGDETDIDCGGSCGPCADGLACEAPADCASGVCEQAACAAPRCGDGVKNGALEQCDDGGESAACDADCTSAGCGDGTVNQAAGEQCDDGDGDDGDDCPSSCATARCGDGFVRDGVELCDDGNDDDGDACPGSCEPARCGDGFVRDGVEECDDGNDDDSDFCSAQCVAATCADGAHNADESDVDCGGHCGPLSCQLGQSCDVVTDCAVGGCDGGVCGLVEPVAAGGLHTCAQRESGQLRCWGNNAFGQLGYGHVRNIGDDELPTTAGLVGVGATPRQVAAGLYHSCTVANGGVVRCWGYNEFGQLGYGHDLPIGNDELPLSAGNVAVGGVVARVAVGGYHTCALLTGGAVKCWGDNSAGQLGQGDTDDVGDDEPPAAVGAIDLGGAATQIAAGGLHTCALLDTGAVRCWGLGASGQLGHGDTDSIGDDEPPSAAGDVPLGGAAVAIAAGWFHTCALLDTGAVKCWGDGGNGKLGYGDTDSIGDDETPADVGAVSVGGAAVEIAAGVQHTCALLDTGAVRCWGEAASGQLGYGDTSAIGDDELPAAAGDVSVGGPVARISAGLGFHTCAQLVTGAVRCWGLGTSGQLGHGSTETIGDDELPSAAGDVAF